MARLEVVPAGSIEGKPDWGQRLVGIGSILSVLFVAIGLYFTADANRETSDANREQERLTEQGQVTDRFTKAVEQLGQPGPEKVDVRLGGIYALERIMRDSGDDQPAVVDILTAFVRVHSPAPERLTPPSPLAVDIQAALTVLGRRDSTHDNKGGSKERLDLANTGLTRADLAEANLTEANLTEANLTRADLTDANLTDADLRAAILSGTDLTDAELDGADLRGAIVYANLTDANLISADLTRADLSSARLTNANLTRADLSTIDLSGVYLRGANLTRANLKGADLTGADLTRADLTGAYLTCARTDDRTRLPEGVARPAPCD
ncbi:pentapeptide repeat-containing protein [Micromonospora sp. NBC_01655]|uniref:pentapeptide repeat-containing protein n=1 Tax=Micromonospora sp. NBC_01655 TaxID=2975983 RepID=UPI0022547519|nr:pentapeptide repeat-containing protein [Micromonospora sp. NBC_01655]MCX4471399.1 pentapeptide repeat-containing protein [Micromonospora sp. NBC_01655]